MAPKMDDRCRAIMRYVGRELDIPVQIVNDIPWREREWQFDAGEILQTWDIARFEAMDDAAYDPIRTMFSDSSCVRLVAQA
jgi:hypothetical protein